MSRALHLVTRLRPGGQGGTLWPTLLTLADGGLAQEVLPMAADAAALRSARLMCPDSVQVPVPPPMRAIAAALRQRLQAAADPAGEPLVALHLHGTPALLLARHVLHACPQPGLPLFVHGVAPALAARLLPGRGERSVLLVRPGRVDALHRASPAEPPSGAEAEVDEVFFEAVRAEAPQPLVACAATGEAAADEAIARALAELAVMMSGIDPVRQPGFGWIGPAPASVQPLLKAAQVRLIEADGAAARAAALASAWVYLAPDAAGLGAARLAEAMAAGLPVVATSAPAYRERVIEALSGELGGRRADLLQALARLVESDALRRDMGLAARIRARHRHGLNRFRGALLMAHGLSPQPVLRHPAGQGAPAAAPA